MPNPDDYIELNRQFVEISAGDIENSDIEAQIAWGQLELPTWPEILGEYRVVILSSAGTGKTWEIDHQCRRLRAEGKEAFFVRLEYLATGFNDVIFEAVGDVSSFQTAVASGQEIWLFLDSIDEARLEGPKAFEKALRNLKPYIKDHLQNTHIILTSRVGAWRPKDDEARVRSLFPFEPPTKKDGEEADGNTRSDDDFIQEPTEDGASTEELPIKYYTLRHLSSDQMRLYSKAKAVPRANDLISEIIRKDMEGLAGRPKDLDDIIAFWRKEGRLGKRLEMVEASIWRKLEEYDPDRADVDPLTPEKAKSGSMKLAASVALTREMKIIVPDRDVSSDGFSISAVLEEWTIPECSALIGRPIFEPETYGFVRFDHRDSKELLAARWFHDLIAAGQSRMRVENLFFKNQYGVDIVIPSLRPILPWLAIFDPSVRKRILSCWPEILLEGGDPASLPLPDRIALLEGYCAKYLAERGARLSVDFGALQRLVSEDMSDAIRSLYETYSDNKETERLLLRSIEIGLLGDLVDIAIAAATKEGQSRYTRLVAMRAVAANGNDEQIASVCEIVAKAACLRSRHELADFVGVFGPENLSPERLVTLISEVGQGEKYSADGLNQAMRSFVSTCSPEALETIVAEVATLIKQEPFVERRFFEVSRNNAWMLNFAIPACERLVEERHRAALQVPALSIMPLVNAARDYDIRDPKTNLDDLIPAWRECNEALFWYDVAAARRLRDQGNGERLIDWWHARVYRRQWQFQPEHIEEVLAWIEGKEFLDDKLVALTLAFSLYRDAGRPQAIRKRLWKTVERNEELRATLKRLLNPPPISDDEKRYRRTEAQSKRRHRERDEKTSAFHAQWREEIPKCLDQVREVELPPEDRFWNSQRYLFDRMREHRESNNRWSQANWRDLIEEFGQEAAEAMRDGLMSMWRRFNPALVSEKGEKGNSYPSIQIMGLSGLEIEFRETENWPYSLTEDEAKQAARYLFCELNGFPNWFRAFAGHFPDIMFDVIAREAEWELLDYVGDSPPHYVIYDIVWDAPWYGERIAPHLLQRLHEREPRHPTSLTHALSLILKCEVISNDQIAAMCAQKLEETATTEAHRNLWYAAWVSVDPTPAIANLADALATMEADQATEMAISFINALNGARMDHGVGGREMHKTVQHLRDLYFLIHQFIRQEEDIERVGGGVYSPTSRDDAQDARGRIYNAICDIPGKEAFDALLEIAESAPTDEAKAWRRTYAIARAKADADTPWPVPKVNEFVAQLECTPTNPRELFDVAVNRFFDLKHEYEVGDFSPAEVVIKTKDEEELRNYLAGELQRASQGRYSISQEDEMPNQQRTDIRFMHSDVPGMVPVELKIADKWSGPKLHEKLRDQLCGDYLRDQSNENGIFLLVNRGEKRTRWRTSGGDVDFEPLVGALQEYALDLISTNEETKHLRISNIQVVGIDLTKRRKVMQK